MSDIYREAEVLQQYPDSKQIPYSEIGRSIYSSAKQELIPFLGAGASLAAPAVPASAPGSLGSKVDPAVLESICTQLSITGGAPRMVMELGIAIASRLQISADAQAAQRQGIIERLKHSASPPSAGELAEALAEAATYDHFDRPFQQTSELEPGRQWNRAELEAVLRSLCELTGVGSSTPSLLEVSGYFESVFKRERLRRFLESIFNQKKDQPACTHKLVAKAACSFIDANRDNDEANDYLIITTNYDGLVEIALEQANVPYGVLTVPWKDAMVRMRFSGVQEHLGWTNERYTRFLQTVKGVPPKDFATAGERRNKPIAIVYKIHGDLHPPDMPDREDTIVISDDDYVRYIDQDARLGMVPAVVTKLMEKRGLLILGYSFRDWNIRSLYRSIQQKRQAGELADWAVLKKISRYERGYLDSNDINMVETSLQRFCTGIDNGGPPPPSPSTP